MRGIATIHQPNYLPWIGLFSKVARTDCFIVADTFQFEPIVRRNKIRTETNSCYLTVPIGAHHSRSRIMDILLPEDRRWQKEHWRSILHNYQKAPYFEEYKDYFEAVYRQDFRYLWQFNLEIITYLLKCFDIRVEIVLTSSLGLDPDLKHTDVLIEILKKVGAQTYLSGPSGKGYLEYEKFPANGIELTFFQFQHPVYPQRYPGFEANLSAIDLLFNMGPQSIEIIKPAGRIVDLANTAV